MESKDTPKMMMWDIYRGTYGFNGGFIRPGLLTYHDILPAPLSYHYRSCTTCALAVKESRLLQAAYDKPNLVFETISPVLGILDADPNVVRKTGSLRPFHQFLASSLQSSTTQPVLGSGLAADRLISCPEGLTLMKTDPEQVKRLVVGPRKPIMYNTPTLYSYATGQLLYLWVRVTYLRMSYCNDKPKFILLFIGPTTDDTPITRIRQRPSSFLKRWKERADRTAAGASGILTNKNYGRDYQLSQIYRGILIDQTRYQHLLWLHNQMILGDELRNTNERPPPNPRRSSDYYGSFHYGIIIAQSHHCRDPILRSRFFQPYGRRESNIDP